MGGGKKPGPLCSTRVGDEWIDFGTNCRSRTPTPGVVGTAVAVFAVELARISPQKAKFDRDHVYSKAPEAARKRDIDLQIIGDDYSRSAEISISNEKYLKDLIKLASNGAQQVRDRTQKIQFFIIRGGAEGFLPSELGKENAADVIAPGTNTDGKSFDYHFDDNDLLAVFDPRGKLIGAALLQRPTLAPRWSTDAANSTYNAWNNKAVSIYRNTNFDVPYLGLVVDDGKKRGWVDMHKQEATNGCIFIVDPATPELGTPELNTFEPKLVKDVLASIGKSPNEVKGTIWLGMMHVVDIKP